MMIRGTFLENFRAIPESGGSLSISNYAEKRRISPTVTDHSSVNILRIDDYSCFFVSAGHIMGIGEIGDSSRSRLRASLKTDTGQVLTDQMSTLRSKKSSR